MKIVDLTGESKGPYFHVTQAKYVDDYKLEVRFNDGERRVVDFGPFLHDAPHPWIRQYLDLWKFKEFKIIDGNVNWNDYELIFPIADLRRGKIEYIPPPPTTRAPRASIGRSKPLPSSRREPSIRTRASRTA